VRDWTCRLTITVDAHFTAENAEEAEREVFRIADEVDSTHGELIGVEAERPSTSASTTPAR
jgi:hypothetical protein